jgi:hypothetical protein
MVNYILVVNFAVGRQKGRIQVVWLGKQLQLPLVNYLLKFGNLGYGLEMELSKPIPTDLGRQFVVV